MHQWSYSSLSNYEKCPFKYYLAKIEGIAEEVGGAAKRGTRIHEAIERYLNFEEDELPDVVWKSFGNELEAAREAGAEAELEFAFDDLWEPTSWDDAWVRGKIDLVVRDKSLIVDFKTGKFYPNHREQASLYALAAMELGITEEPCVEFWYIDLDDVMEWEFKKRDYKSLRDSWNYRGMRLQNEDRWDPRPGPYCKWCAFRSKKGGQCPEG